jgi:hypothetical protein
MRPQYLKDDLDEIKALHAKVKGNPVLDRILSEVMRDYEHKLSVAILDERNTERRQELMDNGYGSVGDDGAWRLEPQPNGDNL